MPSTQLFWSDDKFHSYKICFGLHSSLYRVTCGRLIRLNFLVKGRRLFPTRRMVLLVTDGQSDSRYLTIQSANALKTSGVQIYVVAVGHSIGGIDEIVQVASYPPDKFLFRVENLQGFWNIIKLIVKEVYPGKYNIVNYDTPC